MSASEMDRTAVEPTPAPSPLKTFFVKLAAITCAALVFFYVAFSLVTGFIKEKTDELAILKGVRHFGEDWKANWISLPALRICRLKRKKKS